MAQHNLVLGTAVKSLGDVTLYRRDGKQISRIRVRNVANPRSEAQSITRNFLAPVIKFYGPLSSTLAKSFEGLNKSRSYNEFQRVNIKLARERQWFLIKGAPFTPLPYMVSRGQLTAMQYVIQSQNDVIWAKWQPFAGILTEHTIALVSRGLLNVGYKVGDVVTFILILGDALGNYRPFTTQMIVNTQSTESFDDIFGSDYTITSEPNGITITHKTDNIVAFASIVARPQGRKWLRSTQYLAVADSILANLTSAETKAAAIASYENPERPDGGDVYIDGDGQAYNVASKSGRALLFYGGQYYAKVVTIYAVHYIVLKPANLDEYFYVFMNNVGYLGTNAAQSLSPADWLSVPSVPTDATDINTILLATGSDFYKYMRSIGFTYF